MIQNKDDDCDVIFCVPTALKFSEEIPELLLKIFKNAQEQRINYIRFS